MKTVPVPNFPMHPILQPYSMPPVCSEVKPSKIIIFCLISYYNYNQRTGRGAIRTHQAQRICSPQLEARTDWAHIHRFRSECCPQHPVEGWHRIRRFRAPPPPPTTMFTVTHFRLPLVKQLVQEYLLQVSLRIVLTFLRDKRWQQLSRCC